MPLSPVKQNPEASRDDLRRMSQVLNEVVKRLNGGNGPINLSVAPIATTDITLSEQFSVLLVDASLGNRVVSLPPIGGIKGRAYYIKKIDSSSNTVTIDPDGSETVDGAATTVISSQYVSEFLIAGPIEWGHH